MIIFTYYKKEKSMGLHKILFLIYFFCTLNVTVNAQSNLILNGGLEEWRTGGLNEKPKYWYSSGYNFGKSNQAHSGKFSIQLFATEQTLTSIDQSYNYNYISIEPGATYRLKYWYKGTLKKANCFSVVTWYKGNTTHESTKKKDMVTDASPTEWKQKTIDFVAPQGVDKAGFSFKMKEETSDANNYLLIDDVDFRKIKSGTTSEEVPMPNEIKASAEQREVFISWHPIQIDGVKYNILLNDRIVATINSTNYILQKLQPNTTYTIGVQTIKSDGKKSKIAKKSILTEPIMVKRDDENRIPYVYKIKGFGDTPRTIELFFNDLYDTNAKIAYTLDGNPYIPIDGYKLVFNKSGKHLFVINITESDGKDWTLEYNLNVK